MKHLYSTISTLLVVFFAVNFSSCDNEPDLNFKETQTIINSYLYDNYETGDTLLFLKDSNNIDTFTVTLNLSLVCLHRSLNSRTKGIETDTAGIQGILLISNNEFTLETSILQFNKYAMSNVRILQGKVDSHPTYADDGNCSKPIIIDLLPVDYIITDSIGNSVHLRKGEGVVDFSDGEHTWVLKNNNDSIKQPYFE